MRWNHKNASSRKLEIAHNSGFKYLLGICVPSNVPSTRRYIEKPCTAFMKGWLLQRIPWYKISWIVSSFWVLLSWKPTGLCCFKYVQVSAANKWHISHLNEWIKIIYKYTHCYNLFITWRFFGEKNASGNFCVLSCT